MGKIKPLSEIIEVAKEKHHDKNYDYSLIDQSKYFGYKTVVNIVCPIHGVFSQRMGHHLEGQICPYCATEQANIKRSITMTGKPQKRPKLLHGVGINDYKGAVRIKNEVLPSYKLWQSIISRCYSKKHHAKHPAYKDCSICDEWKYFSNFKKWFDKNYVEGYQIDKDILVKGNKIYSPNTCCFVPQEINCMMEKTDSKRGKYPVGVGRLKSGGRRFYAGVRMHNKKNHLGYFDTALEAFNAYKHAKEEYMKEVAQEYYDKGLITKRVYDALMKYKVEITD